MKLEQTNIFSMFGIEDEVETRKAELATIAAEERAKTLAKVDAIKAQNPSTASKPKEVKELFKVQVDTIVRYASLDIPVTNYFSVEELENGLPNTKGDNMEYKPISENELRKRLEDDFPELVPNFTSLVYVEKKNIIIPMLQAKKKGNVNCMESSTSVGGSLPSKKIPFHLLADFIVLAKEFSDKFGTEIHADIYYDYTEQDFFMDIPKQRVNPVLVTVTESSMETAIKFIDRRYIKVMEIHSHHLMRATPSLTDDMNERAPILYAIVGRINELFPEITVRTFDKENERHISLNPNAIFDNPVFNDNATYRYDTSVVEVA